MKPLRVREELLERGVRIFTPDVFSRIFGRPKYATKYFLERQVGEGLLVRLKRGLYALKTDLPGEEEIANALYQPAYISFEYALAYYGLMPEMPYVVTSATTKPTRLFVLEDKAYSYRSIKVEAFTGYELKRGEGKAFLIADPEKAVVDYFYFVTLNHLPQNDRLMARIIRGGNYAWGKIDQAKILDYASLFDKSRLTELLKAAL